MDERKKASVCLVLSTKLSAGAVVVASVPAASSQLHIFFAGGKIKQL